MPLKINLAACRTNAGMNQKEWAEKLGVSRMTVSSWEKGRSEPSLNALRKISELSGIPLDCIFIEES
jgi:DNA-binding XRE family transcriptional regulator